MTVAAPPVRRPVITGWASISPYGLGADTLSDGARERRGTRVPVEAEQWGVQARAACLVPDFDPRALLGRKGTRSMDRATGLAVATVGMLIADGVPNGPGTGLVIGTTAGGLNSAWTTTQDMLVGERPFYIDAAKIPYVIMNGTAGHCAIWHGLQGPNTTVAAGGATGLTALNHARRLVVAGRAERVLCGGVEEFSPARYWVESLADPDAVIGEGCAMVVVEDDDGERPALADLVAVEFGVARAGELATALASTVRGALARAGVRADEVWGASPGGSGAIAATAAAVHEEIFGSDAVAAVPPVDLLGDTAAASGAFQLALVLGAARPEHAGRYAVITSADQHGAFACALLRTRGPAEQRGGQR
ncbi:beta-ketoacyl synthase N-terminal-like domain-containing protein [Actinokineospora guangxiensis]|uniref:Beta-ketoacyl synthase N-terminal-like domain-containing protein n=1 Tax=Actinokineospora guangxiensis TaxID=1490288 RepID=A0ABW0EH05_9PSEU